MRLPHWTAVVGAVVCLLVPLASLPAQAAGDDDVLPFYRPPATLPSGNGDLVRSEPITYRLDSAGVSNVLVRSTRVLYRSTNRAGEADVVSGSVIVPKAPWIGPGKRPVIGYAVGTQGLDDRCAPSRQFSAGVEYEGIFMNGLLARGYALAVTDYEGLGTPGMHTYMDRVSQGRAVLDAVRAAQRLPGSGLSRANPVALFGYSQGGGGAASAAELAGSYAPELKVKGSVVGAVPADLTVLPDNLDKGLWAEFLWFAIAGISGSYDLDIDAYLNADGQDFLDRISDDCVFDLGTAAFSDSRDYSLDGSNLSELSKEEPFRSMLADQRIGRIRPSAPVLVTHSRLDDTIPFKVGKQLAKDWCAKGGTVRFSANVTPLHVGGMLNNSTEVYGYLEARLLGLPALSSCWRL